MSQHDLPDTSVPPSVPSEEVAPTSKSWIQKTPGVCGGDACIRRTRIAVWMLVNARRVGIPDAELVTHYAPPLTQTDLDAAGDYYNHHPEEIETAIRENEEA